MGTFAPTAGECAVILRDHTNRLAGQNDYHKAVSEHDRDIFHNKKWNFTWLPKNPERREACRTDMERFLRTYFPKAFNRPFCSDHIRLIERTQDAATNGGLYARAMWRGSGKTTIFARSMLWAILYGFRHFGVVISATERDSRKIMRGQQTELWQNPLLAEDFPEVCNPFIALENNGRRKAGQLYDRKPTLLDWGQDLVVLASIPPSDLTGVSGSVMLTRAITGAIRGLNHLTASGSVIRPDFMLLDDVQTRESAKSVIATEDRIATIEGDILGLFGGTTKPTAVQACTPIIDGDLACTYLNRKKKPDWQGDTTSLMAARPARQDLWDQYRALQDDVRRNDGDPLTIARFYADRRADMDAGAVVAWPQGPTFGRISVIQFAMDTLFERPQAFAAEYQCRPLVTETASGLMMSRDQIAAKVSGMAAGVVPTGSQWLTAFVDIGDAYLFYAVCAFDRNFGGSCIEYGAFPSQRRRYFSKSEANPSIADYYAASPTLAGAATESLIAAALDEFIARMVGRTWAKPDGTQIGLSRLLIDAGYKPGVVAAAILRADQRKEVLPVVMPSKGEGIGPTNKPFGEYSRKPGDSIGNHWRAVRPTEQGKLKTVTIDTNYYKSLLHQQFFVPREQVGCFSLYGDRHEDHGMIAEHLTAERPDVLHSETKQRTVTVWKPEPARENEGLDCIVGCFVGAAMLGAELAGAAEPQRRTARHRRSIGEMIGAQ